MHFSKLFTASSRILNLRWVFTYQQRHVTTFLANEYYMFKKPKPKYYHTQSSAHHCNSNPDQPTVPEAQQQQRRRHRQQQYVWTGSSTPPEPHTHRATGTATSRWPRQSGRPVEADRVHSFRMITHWQCRQVAVGYIILTCLTVHCRYVRCCLHMGVRESERPPHQSEFGQLVPAARSDAAAQFGML